MAEDKNTDGAAILLSVRDATELGERGLQRIGYAAEEARVITEHLIDSELCGYGAIGLTRILTIAEHPRTREPRKAVSIVRETPVSALMDGGNYVGLYAVHRAAEVAIQKARANGFALVGMHNAFLSGRNAYYSKKSRAPVSSAYTRRAVKRTSRRSAARHPHSARIRSPSECRTIPIRWYSIWAPRR